VSPAWFAELQRVAVESFGFAPTVTFHEADWLDYFRDGFTPTEALDEDLSYGEPADAVSP
jgi:hypothetical protein